MLKSNITIDNDEYLKKKKKRKNSENNIEATQPIATKVISTNKNL